MNKYYVSVDRDMAILVEAQKVGFEYGGLAFYEVDEDTGKEVMVAYLPEHQFKYFYKDRNL